MKNLRRYFLKKIVLVMRIKSKRTNHFKKDSSMLGKPLIEDLHLFGFIHISLNFKNTSDLETLISYKNLKKNELPLFDSDTSRFEIP